jgi:hypothetical protein
MPISFLGILYITMVINRHECHICDYDRECEENPEAKTLEASSAYYKVSAFTDARGVLGYFASLWWKERYLFWNVIPLVALHWDFS